MKKFNKYLKFIFFLILLVFLSVHFMISFKQYKKEYFTSIEYEFRKSLQNINKTIALSTGFLNVIQSHSQHFKPDINALDKTSYVYLENSIGFPGYSIEHYPYKDSLLLGNLSGIGDVNSLSDETLKDISRAFSLTPLFILTNEHVPNVPWFYYISNNDFLYIYPYVAASNYRYISKIKEHEIFKNGLPDVNPEKEFYWSSVYVDRAEKILTVTLTIPIYYLDKFEGVMALDITLNTLGDYLDVKKFEKANFFIADATGNVIADPRVKLDSLSSMPHVDSLGYFKSNDFNDVALLDDNVFTTFKANHVFKTGIKDTPWSLYFTLSKSQLNYKTFINQLPQLVIALLFIVMMLLVFRISETQKIIRKNEKKFRSVFNEMKQMMFVLTPKAFVSESNSVSCVITGLDENITEDIYFYDLPIWKKTEGLPKLFKQAVQKCLNGENVHFETNLTNHLGFERTLDFTFFPIHDGSGEIFLIIISGYDISDLKETQKQLRDSIKKLKQTQTQLIISEKRAAFGQLAASLAHELNNPIAALKASFSNYKDIVTNNIMSFRSAGKVLSDKEMASCFELVELYSNNSVELSSREKRDLKNELVLSIKSKHPKQAEQIAKYLMSLKISDISVIDSIIDNKNLLLILQLAAGFASMERNDKTILYSIKRTLNIVSSFKEYSSQDIKEFKEEIQPSQVISNVLNLLRPMIREELKFINRIEFDGTILISKDDIYQIFTHLIKNAIQANRSKGQIFMSLISKEDNLIFSVKDQGIGISKEIADKIYEPFFTTKNEGEGAGLGLYIIKNLVKNNNGSLQFESNPDKGTTFKLTLPLK